jgi:hypothetical protein
LGAPMLESVAVLCFPLTQDITIRELKHKT